MELDEQAAARADEVVVMISFEGALIALSLSWSGGGRLDQACFHQKRDRTIDSRGMGVAQTSSPEDTRQILDSKMTVISEGAARYALPHLRVLQLLLSNELAQSRKCSLVCVRFRLGSDHRTAKSWGFTPRGQARTDEKGAPRKRDAPP